MDIVPLPPSKSPLYLRRSKFGVRCRGGDCEPRVVPVVKGVKDCKIEVAPAIGFGNWLPEKTMVITLIILDKNGFVYARKDAHYSFIPPYPQAKSSVRDIVASVVGSRFSAYEELGCFSTGKFFIVLVFVIVDKCNIRGVEPVGKLPVSGDIREILLDYDLITASTGLVDGSIINSIVKKYIKTGGGVCSVT